MSPPASVLAHLLQGRAALAVEVSRLMSAIDDLDAVIARVSGGDLADDVDSEPAADDAQSPEGGAASVHPSSASSTGRRVSSRRHGGRIAATSSAARNPAEGGSAPRSIRLHVLDMLGAENRDFALSEIIDRIHAAGIQAHDDAVRSITIKLMKDGSVERVGRGQYRLAAGLGSDAAASVPQAPASEATRSYPLPLNLDQSWAAPTA